MALHLSLTPEEADALKQIEQRLSKRARYELTLNRLLQQWRALVTQVEQGYQDSIYEYTNDLSARDLLEEILQEVPPSLREQVASWLRPWDARFDRATEKLDRPILANLEPAAAAWWWFRVPKKLGKELDDDLRAEGLRR
ncbi:MAG: hypothetical protein GXO54_02580 [Chloroflexi bacterium]|nr:hypothetical protein [Chloroflexota bacterium]